MLPDRINDLKPRLQPRGRDGFTLVEVLVALTLGALVVLLAHRLFTGVADGAGRLEEARRTLDREANARRWLAAAFGSLDVGEGSGGFAGRPSTAEFASWQLVPEGWSARRRVNLALHDSRLVAAVSPNDSLILADSVAHLELDYLLDVHDGGGDDRGAPGERATFVREWISPVSAPVAVRMRIAYQGRGRRDGGRVDTLLVLVGPRG